MRIDRIKKHFEEEAKEYDGIIKKLIPHYSEMVDALVSVIPFQEDCVFCMIDLGCGTGTISKAVQTGFLNVEITCVDLAETMLEIAKAKLGGNVSCIQADFNTFEFPRKFDLIVSSLALHHLESEDDKFEFYKKIYAALDVGGIFINLDVVLGGSDAIQSVYIEKWKEYMRRSVSDDEIVQKWMPSYYAEDRPSRLTTHLDMLRECGFISVDVICKYYNYAVYVGMKS